MGMKTSDIAARFLKSDKEDTLYLKNRIFVLRA